MAVILYLNPDWQEDDRHRAYWQALGKFISRFALLEQQVHFLLNLQVGISKDVSVAIFSGVRSSEALTYVEKIRKLQDPQKAHLFLDKAKSQFGVLLALRNAVAHFSPVPDGEGLVVSDDYKKMPDSVKRTPVSGEVLEHATLDVETLSACLYFEQANLAAPGQQFSAPDALKIAQRPFLYRPSSQAPSERNRQNSGRGRKRPPKPSPP